MLTTRLSHHISYVMRYQQISHPLTHILLVNKCTIKVITNHTCKAKKIFKTSLCTICSAYTYIHEYHECSMPSRQSATRCQLNLKIQTVLIVLNGSFERFSLAATSVTSTLRFTYLLIYWLTGRFGGELTGEVVYCTLVVGVDVGGE